MPNVTTGRSMSDFGPGDVALAVGSSVAGVAGGLTVAEQLQNNTGLSPTQSLLARLAVASALYYMSNGAESVNVSILTGTGAAGVVAQTLNEYLYDG